LASLRRYVSLAYAFGQRVLDALVGKLLICYVFTTEMLDLENNQLSGTIPTELAMIAGKDIVKEKGMGYFSPFTHAFILRERDTDHCCWLTGTEFFLRGNMLSGTFPTEIAGMPDLGTCFHCWVFLYFELWILFLS
jgi:hypothetical protein